LGLTEVSGFFSRLKDGFDEIGVEAVHVSLQPHRFGYGSGQVQPLAAKWAQAAVRVRLSALHSGNRIAGVLSLPAVVLTRALLFVWALARFDVFILGAGSSFFSFRELPLFRLLGKKLIYTLHGTDGRPAYVDGFFDPAEYGMGRPEVQEDKAETVLQRAGRLAEAHAAVSAKRAEQIQHIENCADVIVCGSGYCSFLTRPFANFLTIGLPISPAISGEGHAMAASGEKCKILHAPSNFTAKGTRFIREVISSLEARGLGIEYVEVSGKPHDQILAQIAASDIVIDQFFSDTPMAAFAAEAGALGKPAVVGGYYSAEIAGHIRPEHLPPTIYCQPRDVADAVASLVLDPAARAACGERANRYVNTRWNPKAVAGRFLELLHGLPEEWAVCPQDVIYVGGVGVSDEQARANVAAVIARFGIAGLGLGHRPDLEKAFVEFAKHPGERC